MKQILDDCAVRVNGIDLPEFLAVDVVSNKKGMIFYDEEEDQYVFKYNKNTFVVEYEDGEATVVEGRRGCDYALSDSSRFTEIDK